MILWIDEFFEDLDQVLAVVQGTVLEPCQGPFVGHRGRSELLATGPLMTAIATLVGFPIAYALQDVCVVKLRTESDEAKKPARSHRDIGQWVALVGFNKDYSMPLTYWRSDEAYPVQIPLLQNRLIVFDAGKLHTAARGVGSDMSDGKLTLQFDFVPWDPEDVGLLLSAEYISRPREQDAAGGQRVVGVR